MRLRVLVGVAALALVLGVATQRGDAHAPPAGAAEQRAVDRGLALLGEGRRFGFRVRVAGRRDDMRAQLTHATRTITLFVDPRDAAHRIAHDLAHELGHAYDVTRLTEAGRAAYLARRGLTGVPWWPGPDGADPETGAGDFAEVFAACHAASPEFRARLAAPPADPCGMLPPDAR